ncbi:outer membrane protein OmpK [Gallaecimonas pentaromativorans]|uniref:outer membrane protein OmpK n=1 Tax=Gallaecimonas pentaromativorans TaxID=584787 RepID=UPI003A91153D
MKLTRQLLAVMLASGTFGAQATEGVGDLHSADHKWLSFNLMHSEDNRLPFQNHKDTYLEIEFGGRSGILDLYGYVDLFDILDDGSDDRSGGDNLYAKIVPRFSLNAISGRDLSFGPVKELYLATEFNIGDSSGDNGGLWSQYLGLGSDIEVPWFGKMGLNLYARYVRENYGNANEKKWDGYKVSTNWFKPVHRFASGDFIAYQGYLDYQFGASKIGRVPGYSPNSIEWFNGIYYHSAHYAVGYGLKYYNNMAFFKDNDEATGVRQDTSGFGHYLSLNYLF